MPTAIQIINSDCTNFTVPQPGICEFVIAGQSISIKVDRFFNFFSNGSTSQFETNINPLIRGRNIYANGAPPTSEEQIAQHKLVISQENVPSVLAASTKEFFTKLNEATELQGDAPGFNLRSHSRATVQPFPNRHPNLLLQMELSYT